MTTLNWVITLAAMTCGLSVLAVAIRSYMERKVWVDLLAVAVSFLIVAGIVWTALSTMLT